MNTNLSHVTWVIENEMIINEKKKKNENTSLPSKLVSEIYIKYQKNNLFKPYRSYLIQFTTFHLMLRENVKNAMTFFLIMRKQIPHILEERISTICSYCNTSG